MRLVDLAVLLGVSDGHLRHLETGIRRPSLALVGRMEAILGLTAADLGATGLPPREGT